MARINKKILKGIKLLSLILGFLGIWFVDIGVSALVLEAQGYDIYIVGFMIKDANTHYHLGLLFISISLISLGYLSLVGEEDEPVDFPNKKG